MTTHTEELDLNGRLSLIESMIAEGRRTTASYGWTFVLWGVAYFVAIGWTNFFHYAYAWPITMTCTAVLMGILIGGRQACRQTKTVKSRAIGAVWYSMGISMFILLMSLGFSRRMDEHVLIAVMAAMLATSNATSSIILRWKMQFACAVVWWALTIFACFGHGNLLTIAFLAALFFCQIVFGIYLMIREARARREEAVHA